MPGQQLPCSITEPGGRGRTGHNRSAPAPALGSVSARGAARGGGVGGRFLHYSLHDHFVTPAPQEGNAKRCLSKCSGSQTLILFLRQERQLIRVRFAPTPPTWRGGRVGAGLLVGGIGSKLSSGAVHHLGSGALARAPRLAWLLGDSLR